MSYSLQDKIDATKPYVLKFFPLIYCIDQTNTQSNNLNEKEKSYWKVFINSDDPEACYGSIKLFFENHIFPYCNGYIPEKDLKTLIESNFKIKNIKSLYYNPRFIKTAQGYLDYDPEWQPGLINGNFSNQKIVWEYCNNPIQTYENHIILVNNYVEKLQEARIANLLNKNNNVYEKIFNECKIYWEATEFYSKKLNITSEKIFKCFFNNHEKVSNKFFGYELKNNPEIRFSRYLNLGRFMSCHYKVDHESLNAFMRYNTLRGSINLKKFNFKNPDIHILYINLVGAVEEEWFLKMLRLYKKFLKELSVTNKVPIKKAS